MTTELHEPREVEWASVVEGDVLEGRDGQAWAVVAAGVELRLERAGRDPFTFARPSSGTVKLLQPSLARISPDPEAEAVANLALRLGATPVNDRMTSDGQHICQATGWDLASMQAHMRVFHSVWCNDVKGTREMARIHIEDHDAQAANPRPGYVPHVHDDAPWRDSAGNVPW